MNICTYKIIQLMLEQMKLLKQLCPNLNFDQIGLNITIEEKHCFALQYNEIREFSIN